MHFELFAIDKFIVDKNKLSRVRTNDWPIVDKNNCKQTSK